MDIEHRVRIEACPAEVFRALANEGLFHGWWRGQARADMRLIDVSEGAKVAWRCVAGPDEWIGTEVTLEVTRDAGATMVSLGHREWRSPTAFMAHCATNWARVLLRMKSWLETPGPEDVLV